MGERTSPSRSATRSRSRDRIAETKRSRDRAFRGPRRDTTLKVGVSGAFLQADLPGGKNNVYRGAVDVTVSAGGFDAWGEVLRQDGTTVTDFPYAGTPATATAPAVPGRASSKNSYVLAGGEYTYDRFTLRYNFSLGSYEDVSVKERMHVPALSVKANDNLNVLTEVVFWDARRPRDHRRSTTA